jgi:hypothetical protein
MLLFLAERISNVSGTYDLAGFPQGSLSWAGVRRLRAKGPIYVDAGPSPMPNFRTRPNIDGLVSTGSQGKIDVVGSAPSRSAFQKCCATICSISCSRDPGTSARIRSWPSRIAPRKRSSREFGSSTPIIAVVEAPKPAPANVNATTAQSATVSSAGGNTCATRPSSTPAAPPGATSRSSECTTSLLFSKDVLVTVRLPQAIRGRRPTRAEVSAQFAAERPSRYPPAATRQL